MQGLLVKDHPPHPDVARQADWEPMRMRSKVAAWAGSGGNESWPSSGWSHLQDALMESLSLTVHLIVSLALGCAESEVHGRFCASVSGLPLGKDGENSGGGLLRGFVSAPV